MVSHAVSAESLGPCFSHSMGDHDRILQYIKYIWNSPFISFTIYRRDTVCFKNHLSDGQQQWASCQIRNIAICACAGNAGNVFPPPRVSDPDMHHGTWVMHVPWCMPGFLTSYFLWGRWRGKRSRHSWRMCNPHFCVSGKRSITLQL